MRSRKTGESWDDDDDSWEMITRYLENFYLKCRCLFEMLLLIAIALVQSFIVLFI